MYLSCCDQLSSGRFKDPCFPYPECVAVSAKIILCEVFISENRLCCSFSNNKLKRILCRFFVQQQRMISSNSDENVESAVLPELILFVK